jgi:hypothetical protein
MVQERTGTSSQIKSMYAGKTTVEGSSGHASGAA